MDMQHLAESATNQLVQMVVPMIITGLVSGLVSWLGGRKLMAVKMIRQAGNDLTHFANLLDDTTPENVRQIMTDAKDTKEALQIMTHVARYSEPVPASTRAPITIVSNPFIPNVTTTRATAAPKTGDADAEMQQAIQASGMANVAVPGMPDGV
jgi:hypothetical protein